MIIEVVNWDQNPKKLEVGDFIVLHRFQPFQAHTRLVIFTKQLSDDELLVTFLCSEENNIFYTSSLTYKKPFSHSCMSYVVKK